jgi:hypothetical protein
LFKNVIQDITTAMHKLQTLDYVWYATVRQRWKVEVPVDSYLSTMAIRRKGNGDVAPPLLTSVLEACEWSVLIV